MSENKEKVATINNQAEDNDGWIDAGEYSLKLEGDVIIARNAKGKVLKTVPAKAKKLEQYDQLDGLRAFLAQHDEHCLDTVRRWFLSSLPVPLSVIIAVWPDPPWRKYLADVIVSDGSITGFLRAVNDDGIQVVDLDGETTTIDYSDAALVTIPHPAVTENLDEWREFAVELGVHQGLDQLFRDVYIKPADEDGQKAAVKAYVGATYERSSHLMGRGRGGGFVTTMGEVSLRVHEGGETITASLDVSAWDPTESAELGKLSFSVHGEDLELDKVGPIAWSEGIRMCEFIYAGRSVKENK